MENGAWRLYRPVLMTISVAVVAGPDAARAESVNEIVASYQQAYTECARAGDAGRRTKAGIWANPYLVRAYGERYRSGLSIN